MAKAARPTRTQRGPPARKRSKKVSSPAEDSDHLDDPSASDGENDAYKQDSDEDIAALDSDALDDEEDEEEPAPVKPGKRKRAAPTSKRSPKKAPARKARKKPDVDEEDNDEDFDDLKEGQEVVGRVVQAPKTGRVPPGQISQNTFDFLSELKKPECNDREWFKLHARLPPR
ncbi:hypothetical protein OF83DRAFT_307107 [Amylostereum chailletii]|nr:hypothetical protein OF83DRAFT_307107 [Amylostereum chailletii]